MILPFDNNMNNIFSNTMAITEETISLNQAIPGGPPTIPGPPSLPSPANPPGKINFDSTYINEATFGPFNIIPGSQSGIGAIVPCDEGDKIISGGYSSDPFPYSNLHITNDRPSIEEFGFSSGWYIELGVTGPVAEVTMYAYCFDNSPEHIP